MTVTVTITQTVDATGPETEGRYLARYNKEHDVLYIYPEGLGRGPMWAMDKASWARINREVSSAFFRADNDERLNAAEGIL